MTVFRDLSELRDDLERCDRDDVGPVCGMAEAVGERIADPRADPPSWCPLRGGGR